MMNLLNLLDDIDFVQLVPFYKEQYHAQEIILKEEDDSQDVYFILSGDVEVSTQLEAVDNGHEILASGLARLSTGDFFGELAMFDGEPRSAKVSAISECVIAKIDGAAMMGFMDRYPEKGYFILREMFMNLVLRMRQNNIRTKTVLDLYFREK